MKVKKRFIAGAACPECKAKDTLRWWEMDNIEYVECVECNYQEKRTPQSLAQSERATEDVIGFFKPE